MNVAFWELSDVDYKVLMFLHHEKRVPSIPYIMEKLGKSHSTIYRSLKSLYKNEYISIGDYGYELKTSITSDS